MDGFISDNDLAMLGNLHGCTDVTNHAETLVTVGRWTRDGRRKGFKIRGFLDYNPSKSELESKRKADRERKRNRGGGGGDSARNPSGSDSEA